MSERLKADLSSKPDEELHRLLYVAMTRAEERLYVCGITTKRDKPGGVLHGLIRRALGEGAKEVEVFPGEIGLRLGDCPPPRGAQRPQGREGPALLPDWCLRPPAEERQRVRRTPSGMTETEERSHIAVMPAKRASAATRGLHIHRLLELLPGIPAEMRRQAAEEMTRTAMGDLNAEERTRIVDETLGVLANPDFADVFGPCGRAEVAVAGVIKGPGGQAITISGQIDRLLISNHKVVAIDFKTGTPPKTKSDIPATYRAQMAAYCAVLAEIYPDKSVEVALLWTEGPTLMRLEREDMTVTSVTDLPTLRDNRRT